MNSTAYGIYYDEDGRCRFPLFPGVVSRVVRTFGDGRLLLRQHLSTLPTKQEVILYHPRGSILATQEELLHEEYNVPSKELWLIINPMTNAQILSTSLEHCLDYCIEHGLIDQVLEKIVMDGNGSDWTQEEKSKVIDYVLH